MLEHSVAYYLPTFWATTPLYAEKIIPLLDNLLSVNSPVADKLALAYYDIWNKYTAPEDMTEESIRAFIRDHGYGYILDLLSLSSNSYNTLLYLLPLIHFLKGSREGLEIVFSLLQVSTKEAKTNITAWWEEDPVAEEDTFSIDSEIDLATIDSSFFEKFDTFIQKYVYPSLTSLNVSYSVSGTLTMLPVLMTHLEVNLVGDMDEEP
jgi:hypothetical protein